MNEVEKWKQEKHGFDVWPDVLRYAEAGTPMKEIPIPDLERMKWYGTFYRKRDGEGSYMLRIRIPGCELTSEQAREVALIAYQYGYGIIDVTTRSNFQVQGLDITKVPKALKHLNKVGLTTKQTGLDNIRNVNCHPYSGIDSQELIDTRELCRKTTDLFIDSREFSDLPRKFNISVNGHPFHGVHYWTQDISYLAYQKKDGKGAFQVLIGGTQGQRPHLGWHLPVLVKVEQVVEVTAAILRLFRTKGSREKRDQIRFRYLIEKIGIAGVLEHLKENLNFSLEPCDISPPPPREHEDFLGWFKQRQEDLWALGVCIPVGRLAWNQLEGMAVIASRWGDATLRTTHDQEIIIPNIPTRFKDEVSADLAKYGLSAESDSVTRNVVACTGRQFCNLAVTETKGYALQLIEKLKKRALVLHGIRIHMSGCINSCAQHHTADIGLKGVRVRRLMGAKDGFDVFLGGAINRQVQLALPYKAGVDVDQLPHVIEEVIKEYYLHRKPGQTFSDYWRERLDGATLVNVLEKDYRPPTWICEKCEYKHLGEDPPIFCPSCSALRRHFARLEETLEEVPQIDKKEEISQYPSPAILQKKEERQLSEGSGSFPTPHPERSPEAVPRGGVEGSIVRDPSIRPLGSLRVTPEEKNSPRGQLSYDHLSNFQQRGPETTHEFQKVAQVSSIPQGRGFCVKINGKEIALFRVNGSIYAIDNLCPHEGGSLAEGEIKDNIVTCPLHGWTFNACTGCGIDPSDAKVARYETKIEGEEVLVKVA